MSTTTRYSVNPTWEWQKSHVQHTLTKGAAGIGAEESCFDVMGFFEGFAPVRNSLVLSVKITFEIPEIPQGSSDWIDRRDIVALYKGRVPRLATEIVAFFLVLRSSQLAN